jgi:hypothetical protein
MLGHLIIALLEVIEDTETCGGKHSIDGVENEIIGLSGPQEAPHRELKVNS